jgi:hypothetical protein
MADINLYGLSLSEAEEAIAEIWNCLEEYNIPSPVMSAKGGANSRMTIGFSFGEPIWAALVSLRLSNSMRSTLLRGRPHGPVPVASETGGMWPPLRRKRREPLSARTLQRRFPLAEMDPERETAALAN